MKILGIETSCDETAVAIVDDRKKLLSHLVLSQLEEHKAFGGVVPEIAARAHLDHLDNLLKTAAKEAKIEFNDLDAIAATCGPGLIGGVMVGMMSGKALAAAINKPFIAINHLEAHALMPRFTEDLKFPYLLLLVSGGHTQLLICENVGQYKRLGTTLDDAAGECFDKCAKLMGLGYPGGPAIEDAASNCKDHEQALEKFPLPRPLIGRKGCDFSFSGLKTAVAIHLDKLSGKSFKREDINLLSYSLEKAISDTVSDRCKNAIKTFKSMHTDTENLSLVVSGGVAANIRIRQELKLLTESHDMSFIAPPISLCSDNGAMIAWAGIERFKLGLQDPLDFSAKPRWPLDPKAEPRSGGGKKA
jgi:N6-L-threonylcarbamoyladenine synthase